MSEPRACPCGAPLEREIELARGVCNRCRIDAHKKPRSRKPKPDYEDVPIPGLEDWGEP